MPLTKAELRLQMRERLRALKPAERAASSRVICEAIAAHPAYRGARVVALFASMATEPDVELLWRVAPRRFVYPRIVEDRLRLFEVLSPSQLQATAGRTFREPHLIGDGSGLSFAEVDLILVPGLAFTPAGERLGRGGGFYDRLLADLPVAAVRFGICFASQLVEELPTEPHDLPVHAVITGSPAPSHG